MSPAYQNAKARIHGESTPFTIQWSANHPSVQGQRAFRAVMRRSGAWLGRRGVNVRYVRYVDLNGPGYAAEKTPAWETVVVYMCRGVSFWGWALPGGVAVISNNALY